MINEIKECLEHLKLVAEKYDGLTDDEKKAVRAEAYKQLGRYGHVLFKVGAVPNDCCVVDHLNNVTTIINAKKVSET